MAHLSAQNNACYKLEKSRNVDIAQAPVATEQPRPVDIPFIRTDFPHNKTASFESQSATAEAEETVIQPHAEFRQVKKTAEELVRRTTGQGLSHTQQLEMLQHYS